MSLLRQINLFNKNLIAIFKIMFCFTFVSDHNIDSLMLYLVRLENIYSILIALRNCQILCVVSPVNNRIATCYHYTNSLSSFILFLSYKFLHFPSTSCLV